MSSTVRRAGVEDAAIVALLGRLTFRETFSSLFVNRENELHQYLDRTFNTAKIAASLAKPENRYWTVDVDGLPVGYAKLKFPSVNRGLGASAPAQLQKIYVLAEFISQKSGSALMDAMAAEATRLGIDGVWLNVLASNRRAIAFYERQGWTRAGKAAFAIGSQSFHFLTLTTSWRG